MWHQILAIPTLWYLIVITIGAAMFAAAYLRNALERRDVVQLNLLSPTQTTVDQRAHWRPLLWLGVILAATAVLMLITKFIALLF